MFNPPFLAESIAAVTPALLAELDPTAIYSLQKTASKRPNSYVVPGDKMRGVLSIVDVAELGKPGVRVTSEHRLYDYIRTSPVLTVKRLDESTLEFETEGGTYLLRAMGSANEW